jgi:hypothetical protein
VNYSHQSRIEANTGLPRVSKISTGGATLALGTSAMHLFGSLLLTIAGIRTATYFIAAQA